MNLRDIIERLTDEQLTEMQQCIEAEQERRSLNKLEELRSLPERVVSEYSQEPKPKPTKDKKAVQSIGADDWKGWMRQSIIDLSDIS